MTTITREIKINALKSKVWDVLADFGNISYASPGVSNSYLTSDIQKGIGTTRHCDFAMMGATAEEKITGWKEGEWMSIDAYKIEKLPGMKSMGAEFYVREENGHVVLKGSLRYSMKNPLFAFMNQVMFKKANEKNWNKVLAGYKKYIETGEKVTRKTQLDLDAVRPAR